MFEVIKATSHYLPQEALLGAIGSVTLNILKNEKLTQTALVAAIIYSVVRTAIFVPGMVISLKGNDHSDLPTAVIHAWFPSQVAMFTGRYVAAKLTGKSFSRLETSELELIRWTFLVAQVVPLLMREQKV